MRGLLALVIGSAMFALPSVAGASTVGFDPEGTLVIEAEPGEVNDVALFYVESPGFIVVDEAGITAGDGCAFFPPALLQCEQPEPGEPRQIEVMLGDESDEFHSGIGFVADVRGGPGRDLVEMGPAPSGTILRGGLGPDVLSTEAGLSSSGDNTLFGGPGADQLFAGFGDDTLFGGPGADQEDAGQGDDTLGGARDSGPDSFQGRLGHDRIDARDSIADLRIDCGRETDPWPRRDRGLDPRLVGCEGSG